LELKRALPDPGSSVPPPAPEVFRLLTALSGKLGKSAGLKSSEEIVKSIRISSFSFWCGRFRIKGLIGWNFSSTLWFGGGFFVLGFPLFK
jgi:hypothetical protein